MSNLAVALKAKWASAGVAFDPGASPRDIASFEERYSVRLPKDLREVLLTVNGTAGTMDDDLFEFFPLDRIRPISDELIEFTGIPDYGELEDNLSDLHRWFVLVDYLITSHVYAIRLSEETSGSNPVIWICGGRHHEIASSFTDFLENYLVAGHRILFPNALVSSTPAS